MGEQATPEGPARRRTSWSLKTIVEDVAGRPVHELQDPDRPVHPYWVGKVDPNPPPTPRRSQPQALDRPEAYDPVGHLYPPLVGATGREFHGPELEHHPETLARHRGEPSADGGPSRPIGPSGKPERLYLHYLLLHLDRLSDSALRYLRHAVEEETAHRSGATPDARPAPATEPTATTVPPVPEEMPPPATSG